MYFVCVDVVLVGCDVCCDVCVYMHVCAGPSRGCVYWEYMGVFAVATSPSSGLHSLVGWGSDCVDLYWSCGCDTTDLTESVEKAELSVDSPACSEGDELLLQKPHSLTVDRAGSCPAGSSLKPVASFTNLLAPSQGQASGVNTLLTMKTGIQRAISLMIEDEIKFSFSKIRELADEQIHGG